MNLLLDTNALVWWMNAPSKLLRSTYTAIADPANETFVSAVTSFEIATKHAIGRLRLPEPPDVFVPRTIAKAGLRTLALESEHALRAGSLPLLHRDPFDRLLIGQALMLGLTIVTSDRIFSSYGVKVLPAA